MAQFSVKATSDVGTKLYSVPSPDGKIATSGYKWLFGVKATPDKSGSYEQLDTTELHDPIKTNMKGRKDQDELVYEVQHTEEKAKAAKKLEGQMTSFLEVFQEGDGYVFVGDPSYDSTGVELNAVHMANLSITVADIRYVTSDEVTEMISG